MALPVVRQGLQCLQSSKHVNGTRAISSTARLIDMVSPGSVFRCFSSLFGSISTMTSSAKVKIQKLKVKRQCPRSQLRAFF